MDDVYYIGYNMLTSKERKKCSYVHVFALFYATRCLLSLRLHSGHDFGLSTTGVQV
jgi:hypothetical protein